MLNLHCIYETHCFLKVSELSLLSSLYFCTCTVSFHFALHSVCDLLSGLIHGPSERMRRSVCVQEWIIEAFSWCPQFSPPGLSRTTRSPPAPSPHLIRCTPLRCGGTEWWPRRSPRALSWPPALSALAPYEAGYLEDKSTVNKR